MVEGPRQVAERFIRAIASKDAETIVAMLDPESLALLVQSASRTGWNGSDPVEAARRLYDGFVGQLLGEATIDSVTLEGPEARVTYRHPKYGRDPDDVFFIRQLVGEWVVHLPSD